MLESGQSTARKMFRNSAVPFFTRLIGRGLDFAFAIILVNSLPGDAIGPYTLAALLVVQYLGTFTEFGLGVLLTREIVQTPSIASQLFGAALLIRLILVLAAVPVTALLVGAYDWFGQRGLGEAISAEGQQVIWILLLTLVPAAYASSVTTLYNASERMEVPALMELGISLVSTAARIVLLLLGFGITALAWSAVAMSTLTAFVYFVLQVRGFFRPTLSWDWTLITHLIRLALPLMLSSLLNVVFFRFDIFIVKLFGRGQGDWLVQQYALAYQVLSVPLILPPVITFAVFPLLARRALGERPLLAQAQNRVLKILLLLALPIAMGTCVLAPDLVRLFTWRHAASYLPISGHVLAILAWFLPLSFVNGLLQYVLIALNQQRVITRAFLLGALFNFTANVLTIPTFGLYAASVVTILSEIVLFGLFLPVLRREGLLPPLVALARRPVLATLGLGAAMLLAKQLHWLAAALIAVPLYGATLWWLGVLGAQERAFMRQLLRFT